MTTSDQIAILAAIKDDSVVDLLMREYQILQEKIDKIGGFRFTIKGWALTLDIGAVVAAFATSLDRHLSVLLVLGVVGALWLLELRQTHLSEIFQNRAFRIEKVIMRRLTAHGLRRADVALLMGVPGIAGEIRSPLELRSLAPSRRRGRLTRWLLRLQLISWVRRSGWRKKLTVSDFYFYFLLWVVASLFLWFHSAPKDQNRQQTPSGHVQKIVMYCDPARAVWHGGAIWHASAE